MNEQIKGENAPSPENTDDKKDTFQEALDKQNRIHKALWETMDEEDRIMKEMDKVFETTSDQNEAEKIILEKWALLMDEAVKKTGQLTTEWFEAIKKSQKEYEKGREE
ncbi:hypothetical protein KAU19_02480 [Candidatus Parcubacteria bacterium]|nr:hypothetical protein [Candidatus Parcubacteria bacterium]